MIEQVKSVLQCSSITSRSKFISVHVAPSQSHEGASCLDCLRRHISSYGRINIQCTVQECQNVGAFFDFLVCRFTGTMAGLAVNAQQNRILLVFAVLDGMVQGGRKLQRMQRADPVIVVGRQNQCGRILIGLSAWRAHIVQRREFDQILEMLLFAGIAIVGHPCMADGELVETQHIHNAHLSDGRAIQLGSLVDAGTDQQTAVRAALDGNLLRLGVFVLHQVFGGRLEIIESILLVQQASAVVPFLSVFASAADVRDRWRMFTIG